MAPGAAGPHSAQGRLSATKVLGLREQGGDFAQEANSKGEKPNLIHGIGATGLCGGGGGG